eukprot:5536508-Amphidinium_carterae.1
MKLQRQLWTNLNADNWFELSNALNTNCSIFAQVDGTSELQQFLREAKPQRKLASRWWGNHGGTQQLAPSGGLIGSG